MFKDYYEARNWLESFIPYTYSKKNLGLERIEYLLKLFGDPHKKFKSILVAGTSGKGSTAFYIANLLQFSVLSSQFSDNSQSVDQLISLSSLSLPDKPKTVELESDNRKPRTDNFKVGLHLSPHLSYIGERMVVNGGPISVKSFIRLIGQVRPIVERIKRDKAQLTPSYFEILVAASFLYFAQEKVDWAVVEVGLGGRLDATNILEPEAVVITNIGLDHTDILGKTIEKIAWEKAGIIKGLGDMRTYYSSKKRVQGVVKDKKGMLVVTGAAGEGLKVIEKVAREKNAQLITVGPQLKITGLKTDIKDYLNIYKDIDRDSVQSFAYTDLTLALATVLALGFKPNVEHVWKVNRLGFEGRFEEIDENVILDGAHNLDKIEYLLKMIKNYSNYSNNQSEFILVAGFKKGKSWEKMVDLLLKNLPVREVIATKFSAVVDTGRFSAVAPEEITKYVSSVKCQVSSVKTVENSQEAVFEALNANSLDANQLILVTGSLYLVGEARTLWKLPDF